MFHEPMELVSQLIQPNDTKLVLVVLDGLGDVPTPPWNETPLEHARTPNLDSLARISALGAIEPVFKGITPGSGPGHLALFGYDPVKVEIKRGIMEVLGMDMEVKPGDVALRGNFATVEERDGKLVVTDRRAGRIPTELNQRLVAKLRESIKEIGGVQVILKSGLEHRFAVIFRDPRGPLSDEVTDTDPQKEGKPPLEAKPLTRGAERTAELINEFVRRAAEVLKDEKPANYVLLRGASGVPHLPKFTEVYKLKSLAIATYPMYRGIAKILGFDELPMRSPDLRGEVELLKEAWGDYHFFFLHYKATDKAGEDGNFLAKVRAIEEFDKYVPEIVALQPDVLVITGDHSTPCMYRAHGFQPVPYMLRADGVFGGYPAFNERVCLTVGELGIFPAIYNMSLMLAYARRLRKFRA